MSKAILFAAALAALGSPTASHAETARIDCVYGEMTIGRIADGECTARIPLPTPRPQTVAVNEELPATPAAPLVKPEYIEIETSGGETKLIRLVGPRFLPEDEMDLRSHSSASVTGSVFSRAVAYFGFGASENDLPAQGVQEARADLVAKTASN